LFATPAEFTWFGLFAGVISPQSFYQNRIILSEEEIEIHLWDYVRVVLSRLQIAVTVFLGVLVIAGIYSLTRVPKYEAKARLEIQSRKIDILNTRSTYEEDTGGYNREFIPTQLKWMTSKPVMERILKDHPNIQNQPEIRDSQDPVKALQQQFKVGQERNTRLVNVAVLHESGKVATDYVNALVDAYQKTDRERRSGVSSQGIEDLTQQKEEQRFKLQAAEQEIRKFKEENKITSFDQEYEIRYEALKGLNESKYRAEPNRIALQAKVEAAERAAGNIKKLQTLPNVLQTKIYADLLTRLTNLQADYEEAKLKFGANHQALNGLVAQMNHLEESLQGITVSLIEMTIIENETATKEAQMLQASIIAAENRIAEINNLALDYDELKSEHDNIQANFKKVSERIEEIQLTNMGQQGDFIHVVEYAEQPKNKSWPNHFKNLLLAGFLGTLLAVGTCFFLNYMDTTMKDIDDVRAIYNCEILGSLPPMGTDKGSDAGDFLAVAKPRSHFAEAFRMIRTNLAFADGGNPPKIIAVTSAMPSEGKSIVSMNIAIAQAQLGKRTVLIDADMRKPRLHEAFGVDKARDGLATLLQGTDKDDLAKGVVDAAVPVSHVTENLFLIPCGGTPRNPAELLDSDRFLDLVKALDEEFDYVIFDSPPSTSLVDSFIIASKVDGLIIVVKTFSTQKGTSSFLAENMRNANVKLLGAVCNNKDMPKASRFSYYYSKYGKYGYGRYGGYYYYYYSHGHEEDEEKGLLSRFKRKKKDDKAQV